MMALEARRMGYRIAVLDPDPEGPAAQIADHCEQGAFDDAEAAIRLAERSDVLTLDTEHIPAELLEKLEAIAPVRPNASILRIVQDRLEQRRFLDSHRLPQTAHESVLDEKSLRAATEAVGFPSILKTRRSGYDGKGQARLESEAHLAAAWHGVNAPAMLEAFVDFEKEIAVVLARDLRGNVSYYEIPENTHERHILHTSRIPARIPKDTAERARHLGKRIADALGHVGVMAIEMFVTRGQELLVNEIAPRTHNSGHYTFGACVTSQFEQHVRAVCGLPLGDPKLLSPAVMVNLLGDLWLEGMPSFESVLSSPNARLHLYGKSKPTPGRKMGHVLVLDEDLDRAMALAESFSSR
jgi:5-(carboxyamino)imidazole ribonucleotide synthase